MEAAERVRIVLIPVLGPARARERANNIAQALLFDSTDSREVALDMLREVPAARRLWVAEQVSRAWSHSVS